MAMRSGTTGQNAACGGYVQAVDAGTTNPNGRVLFYSGTQPATPQTSPTGSLLATVNLNTPAFGTPANGTSALNTSSAVTGTVSASGTVGWFRVIDRNGNAIWDGKATGTGGDGQLTFDVVDWVASGVVTLNSGVTVTFGM